MQNSFVIVIYMKSHHLENCKIELTSKIRSASLAKIRDNKLKKGPSKHNTHNKSALIPSFNLSKIGLLDSSKFASSNLSPDNKISGKISVHRTNKTIHCTNPSIISAKIISGKKRNPSLASNFGDSIRKNFLLDPAIFTNSEITKPNNGFKSRNLDSSQVIINPINISLSPKNSIFKSHKKIPILLEKIITTFKCFKDKHNRIISQKIKPVKPIKQDKGFI